MSRTRSPLRRAAHSADDSHGRRRFLRNAALVLPAAAIFRPSVGSAIGLEKRSLSFRHTHTNVDLSVVYYSDGRYLPEALGQIDHLLRDFRTEEIHVIDPNLLDFLYDLSVRTGSRGVYDVISGYRSPATNAQLRKKSKGVAKKSLHMLGRAIDVRLTDVGSKTLRDAAIRLQKGGVGYYARSDFVHLDTGRFRTW